MRGGLRSCARILPRTFRPFARRLKLRDRRRLRLRVGHLLVGVRPVAATRESGESYDGEEDAGESDDVRDELRGVGEAPMDADELPVDVEDPEVRALVPGGRRRQVELRVSGRPEGHVAVDFVLCDERGPDVSPQGVGFRDSATRGGTKIEDKPELVELEGEESAGAPKRGAPGREVSGAVDRSPLGFGWGRRTRSDVYGVATRFSVPRVVSSATTAGSARARAASRRAWIRVKTHCRLSRGWSGVSGPADRTSRARVAPDASGHVICRSRESFAVPRIRAITNASPPCQTTWGFALASVRLAAFGICACKPARTGTRIEARSSATGPGTSPRTVTSSPR